MIFRSSMSRPASATPDPSPLPVSNNSSPVTIGSSPTDQRGDGSSSPQRMSKDSEGYPTWLPKRPPPPAPASTFHSSMGGLPDPSPIETTPVGRKPTERSVRIVSLQDDFVVVDKDQREPIPPGRDGAPAKVWSRATGAALTPGVFSSPDRVPQPRFRARGLHLELLRNPSRLVHFYFHLYPLLVFTHIPLQSYFDFNAVFILFQVSKFPNPQAPGVPGSGKNWTLGAAAYIACWLVWILIVFIFYEIVYSFARRWRVKRPAMLTIYLSAPAFNLAALSSYTNFSFMQHIRYSSFFGEHGSLRDGLAETFYYYSQNLPTVALLLPRAGLCLALLLTFSVPQAGIVTLANGGVSQRDPTFFRRSDGTLTNYARGVLIANAAWTAWRVLVLLMSWIGLWVVSGKGCMGFCGPRYRWEEEQAEKHRPSSVYSDAASDLDDLPWGWRECTRMRVQDAYEFCLTVRPSLRWSNAGRSKEKEPLPPTSEPFDGVERVLAAAGFPSLPTPARRGVLTQDLFDSPQEDVVSPPVLSSIIPKVVKRSSRDRVPAEGPLMQLPYPFTARGAQASSSDRVPFPPSVSSKGKKGSSKTGSTGKSSTSSSKSTSGVTGSEEDDVVEEGEEVEDEEEEEEEEEDEEEEEVFSEEPSSGRASGSMSSLGHPVSPRYALQARQAAAVRGRGNSMSGSSHITSHSMMSMSTGNRESSDSQSPMSLRSGTSSDAGRARSSLSQSSTGIPMPPRHPRPRVATSPSPTPVGRSPVIESLPSIPIAVEFPSLRDRRRGEPGPGFDPATFYSEGDEHDEDEEADEEEEVAAEREDRVGLLGSRTSLALGGSSGSSDRSRASSVLSAARSRANSAVRSRSRADSNTPRSRTNSAAVRSRASSLGVSVRSVLQSVGVASQTSLDVVRDAIGVRSRASSSMARLEEDVASSSDRESESGSGSGSGSGHDVDETAMVAYISDPEAAYLSDRGGYYSSSLSGGTHSRSGSGSGAENYTFGQPMPFMRPSPSQLRVEVHEADIDEGQQALVEGVEGRESPDRLSPHSSRKSLSVRASTGNLSTRPSSGNISPHTSSSRLSVTFHTPEESERTASPQLTATPGRENSPSPEREGVEIPIMWQQHPQRYGTHLHPSDASATSESPPDISTAAGSFVTAPVSIEGATTSGSSGGTVSSSWEGVGQRTGPNLLGGRDDPSGGSWRVV